jgi:hypothetical protein
MPHGRRLVRTEEENFQAWLEKNWDRPLSDEVERLQDALKRLESTHAGDIRRLRGAESKWWRLLRIAFVVCLGLVALLLWYIDRYSETKSTLEGVCAFVAHEVSETIKEDARGRLPDDLKEVNSVCIEKAALAAIQMSR